MGIVLHIADQTGEEIEEILLEHRIPTGARVIHEIYGDFDSLYLECGPIDDEVYLTDVNRLVQYTQCEMTEEMWETLKKIRHEGK